MYQYLSSVFIIPDMNKYSIIAVLYLSELFSFKKINKQNLSHFMNMH